MSSLPKRSRGKAAEHWPSTDEIDGFTYAPVPDHDDAEGAASNLKDGEVHADDGPAPDDPVWDQWAGEAEAVRQHEAGLRMF